MKDFYQTLGVTEKAAADEIKKAYRKLAKKYHPDATGGDKAKEARFKEITEAYETVGDEKKRAAYDDSRRNPFAGGGVPGGGFRGGAPGGQGFDINDIFSQFGGGAGGRAGNGRVRVDTGAGFSDIFGGMFGAAAQQQRQRAKGEDLITKIEIDLPEAALGAEKSFTLEGKKLTVKIPAGITSGKTIRLTGQGRPGPGGSGDLLIEVHERPHDHFRRREGSADIEVDAQLPLADAILGGKLNVPTLEGTTVSVTIPPHTSSGKKLRLKGKGAVTRTGRGDLYAVVLVQVPDKLEGRAKELLDEFAKITRG